MSMYGQYTFTSWSDALNEPLPKAKIIQCQPAGEGACVCPPRTARAGDKCRLVYVDVRTVFAVRCLLFLTYCADPCFYEVNLHQQFSLPKPGFLLAPKNFARKLYGGADFHT